MSGILAFLKARLVVVVLVVLILAMLPTAWIISGKLNKKIVDAQTKAYQDEKQKIQRASRVTYTLPRISTSESADALTATRAPNDRVTNWFKEQRSERAEQIDSILGRVVDVNRSGHGRLLEAFPPPDDADPIVERRAAQELARKIIGGTRNYERSLYEILFERMGAGTPPDREAVAQSVDGYAEQVLAQIESLETRDAAGAQAQRAELSKQLVDRRIGEYRRVAREISFYGSTSAVTGETSEPRGRGFGGSPASSASSGNFVQILTAVPERATMAEAYKWQWDYWVIEDLLGAIARANTDQAGDPTPVPLSVVKRVKRISLYPFTIPEAGSAADAVADYSGFGGTRVGAGASSGSTADVVTLTGRKASGDSYDVRRAQMVLIVNPARVIELLDAIKKTNLMTVTDLDLEAIDPWEHLREGYFYGEGEHVMRATIEVESVWLREWTKQFMPGAVRKAMGITETKTETDGEG